MDSRGTPTATCCCMRSPMLCSARSPRAILEAIFLLLIRNGRGPTPTFVLQALTKVREAGWEVCNVDSTLILDAPKIGPVADRIRESIAQLLEISREDVGVK